MLPKHLKKGDKIAIVSLSSGILGENFVKHEYDLGVKRLKEFGLEVVFMSNSLKGLEFIKNHPEARAADLKDAFLDDEIKGILCAIGGNDTYRTLPYLLEDEEFSQCVRENPKIFIGFSDSTVNHFMFYKLGLPTFYGQAFLPDLAELGNEMLAYTKSSFENLFYKKFKPIVSSPIWYLEREDFSPSSVGIPRKEIQETKGYEVLQGQGVVDGSLLGGCLESMYDMLSGAAKEICDRYQVFPSKEEWAGKILLLETSERQVSPSEYKQMLSLLKEYGIFEEIKGIIHGKPMDEKYYQEYKKILVEVVHQPNLPILYNVNVGHATPRGIYPLNSMIRLNLDEKIIETIDEVLS